MQPPPAVSPRLTLAQPPPAARLPLGVWPLKPGYACGKGYDAYPFCNTSLSTDERVKDLVQR